MRSEAEMYDLILKIAKEDSRIRAAYMNGSRTNKNVPQDIFRDYDVVYVVTINCVKYCWTRIMCCLKFRKRQMKITM